jgi:AraC-like DNA-binding protein
LNEPAARDAILCAGDGKTLFIGCLDQVTWHRHGTAALVAGLTGDFRLRGPSGRWVSCRAAAIPAGVRHALDVGGAPLAVFYPEPDVATLSQLARLGGAWYASEQILVGRRAPIQVFREIYERQGGTDGVTEALADLMRFARAGTGPPALDPRIARALERLRARPGDPTGIARLAAAEGLSASRFLHLFKQEVGIPFRRFRIWNRLRAASRLALAGASLTEAALAAGFADSAHFARLHRESFGVSASSTLRRLARVVPLGG